VTLQDRIRALVEALPSANSAVTLTRADLKELLQATESGTPSRRNRGDLTVEDVAEEVGRAPSTVRGWLIAGALRGYKLNGRDWRVPRSALREYLRSQGAERPEPSQGDDVDIGEWRRVRGKSS